MARGDFVSMVHEGANLVHQFPHQIQHYLYGPIISSRVLAGSLGGLINRLLGFGDRNQLAASLQPAVYPFVTTASAQSQTTIQVGQFGNFVCTKLSGVVTTASAPAVAASYDFTVQFRFGRTDFQWAQDPGGMHIAELLGVIGGATAFGSYTFPKAIIVERAATIIARFSQLTASARTFFFSFHGFYDFDVSASSATSVA